MIVKAELQTLDPVPQIAPPKYPPEEVEAITKEVNLIRARALNGEIMSLEDQRKIVLHMRMHRTVAFEIAKSKVKQKTNTEGQEKVVKPKLVKKSKWDIDPGFIPSTEPPVVLQKLVKKFGKDTAALTWNELKIVEYNLGVVLISEEDYRRLHNIGM